MTRCVNEPTATNRDGRNIDKWIALGLMQRIEQIYSIAGMLAATMEDLSDQMTELESELEYLSDATEELQEKMDSVVDLVQEEMNRSPNISEIAASSWPEGFPL